MTAWLTSVAEEECVMKRVAGALTLVILVLGLMTYGISMADGEPDINVSTEPIYVKGSGEGYAVRLLIPKEFDAEPIAWNFSACPAKRPDLEYYVSGDSSSFRNPVVIPESELESTGRWFGNITIQYEGYEVSFRRDFDFVVTEPESSGTKIRVTLKDTEETDPKIIRVGESYQLEVKGDPEICEMKIFFAGMGDHTEHQTFGNEFTGNLFVEKGRFGIIAWGKSENSGTWDVISNPLIVYVLDAPERRLNLPTDTISVEDEAFAGIRDLTIRIPGSVTSIADSAFDSSAVILCREDSYAKAWAEKNGIMVIIER